MVAKKRKPKVTYRQVGETTESQSRIEWFYNFIFERAHKRWKDARASKSADSSESA